MSALMELIRDRLGRDPVEWIREQRAAGVQWDRLPSKLYEAAQRWVSIPTLRAWLAEADRAVTQESPAPHGPERET
jgi:hypothetical protein